jgi:hypothetical protein
MLEPSGPSLLDPFVFNGSNVLNPGRENNIIKETNRIINKINNADIPVVYHACGDTSPYFSEKGMGFFKINVQGVSFDRKVPAENIVKFWKDSKENGNSVVIFGNSESENFDKIPFPEGIVKEGRDVVSGRLKEIEKAGELIPTTSCEITALSYELGMPSLEALGLSFNPEFGFEKIMELIRGNKTAATQL